VSDLQPALEIAVTAHKNQQEKNGSPYLLHPIGLMLAVKVPEAKIAALLHDVVEDTDIEMGDRLNEGFSEGVISALKLLTHDDGSEYGQSNLLDWLDVSVDGPGRVLALAEFEISPIAHGSDN
jgi:(p)ppGpp synthase/HD superfamily hydrolase